MVRAAAGAWDRAGDPSWYPTQLAPEHGGTGPASAAGGLAPWTPLKLYEQAIPASVRNAMRDRLKALGRDWWEEPGEDATAEERAEFEERMARMLVPDEAITTRVDVGPYLEQKYEALLEHVTQMAPDHPFLAFGVEGWRDYWPFEAFILRDSRVGTSLPESDLFAGVDEPRATT